MIIHHGVGCGILSLSLPYSFCLSFFPSFLSWRWTHLTWKHTSFSSRKCVLLLFNNPLPFLLSVLYFWNIYYLNIRLPSDFLNKHLTQNCLFSVFLFYIPEIYLNLFSKHSTSKNFSTILKKVSPYLCSLILLLHSPIFFLLLYKCDVLLLSFGDNLFVNVFFSLDYLFFSLSGSFY